MFFANPDFETARREDEGAGGPGRSDLLTMKLRACYLQTVKVFRTIHKMDHFVVTMEKCPACGRFREQSKIRVLANPCNKMVGCERCRLEIGCEIERKSQDDYQADRAFYQCEHGLWAFGDQTEDCHNYRRGGSSVTGSDKQPSAPRNSLQVGCPATVPIVTTPTSASTKASGGVPPRVALQPADDLSDPASAGLTAGSPLAGRAQSTRDRAQVEQMAQKVQ